MNRRAFNRYFIYLTGVVFLSAGITLNTKTNLGVASLIALPYTSSEIWGLSFPLMTFLMYVLFIVLQLILKRKNRQIKDLLQIPLSMAFSLLLDIFGRGYDEAVDMFDLDLGLSMRFALLFVAIIMTGVGVSMMIAMELVPNPADGLAEAVGTAFKKGLGFGKNFIDISSVAITCAMGLIFRGHVVGVGIGTVISMIAVGRSIAVFNHFFLKKMRRAVEGCEDI